MCELLGVSCNNKVKANISFKVLQSRANNYPDGWGLAYYPDQSAQIFKEPFEADKSKLADFVAGYDNISSKIFLCHIRKWRPESRAYKNTHPFLRELDGKAYTFAHNGAVPEDFHLKRFHPIGDTDSERFFCHLMDFIAQHALELGDEADLSLLEDHLRDINRHGNTKLNCLLSDGNNLLCYRDSGGLGGLCLLERKPDYLEKVKIYEDDELQFRFRIQKASDELAVIVATRPLTNENWSVLSPGSLTVLRDGQSIYPADIEPEENNAIEAEVYAAPRWANSLAGFPNVIGMPKSLRQALGVKKLDRVLVSNENQSMELNVWKSAEGLVKQSSSCSADNRECHVWLHRTIRTHLHLEETDNRRDKNRFRKRYAKVAIRKLTN
jgi:predicted glutamine amidotransferase